MLMLIRCAIVYGLLSMLTSLDTSQKFTISLALLYLMMVLAKKPVEKVEEPEFEELPSKLITDVSDEIACKYQDKIWPVWLEVDKTEHFMFFGQHHGKSVENTATLDEDTIVLPPGVLYRRIKEEHLPELASMLGVPLSQLEIKG